MRGGIIKINVLLNIIGLLLGTVGAFFLVKGTLSMQPEQILELATTKATYNPDLITSLSFQRGDTVVGFSLVLMGFLSQLIVYVSERIIERTIALRIAYIIIISMVLIIAIGSYKSSLCLGDKTRVKSLKLAFRNPEYNLWEEKEEWIIENGKKSFGISKRNGETFEEYKKRLSEFVNKDP